ncbi:MAG TPA: hypothetical protein VF121_16040 [Thermoanaerobaculia bacterium]|nr:hypothetical protein [Thermoanaerobaculia bacterium]
MSRRWNRTLVSLALLAILATAPAAAARSGRPDRNQERFTPLVRMMEFLDAVRDRLIGVWEMNGLVGDPNG